MKAIVLALVFSVFSSCTSVYSVRVAYDRYAIVQDSANIGSGVRCGNGMILTATHLVTDSMSVTTPEREFRATSVRISDDVTLLYGDSRVDTTEYGDVQLGQEVFWIQPRFEEGGGAFLTFGHVSFISDSSFFLDRPVMFGVSGSGVWTYNGALVGIVQSIVPIHQYPMYARATRLSVYQKGGVL